MNMNISKFIPMIINNILGKIVDNSIYGTIDIIGYYMIDI